MMAGPESRFASHHLGLDGTKLGYGCFIILLSSCWGASDWWSLYSIEVWAWGWESGMKTQADVLYLASGKFFNHLSLTAGAPRDSELHTILLTQDQNLHSGVVMEGGVLGVSYIRFPHLQQPDRYKIKVRGKYLLG